LPLPVGGAAASLLKSNGAARRLNCDEPPMMAADRAHCIAIDRGSCRMNKEEIMIVAKECCYCSSYIYAP
jgi:hypothetical protein